MAAVTTHRHKRAPLSTSAACLPVCVCVLLPACVSLSSPHSVVRKPLSTWVCWAPSSVVLWATPSRSPSGTSCRSTTSPCTLMVCGTPRTLRAHPTQTACHVSGLSVCIQHAALGVRCSLSGGATWLLPAHPWPWLAADGRLERAVRTGCCEGFVRHGTLTESVLTLLPDAVVLLQLLLATR